MFSVMYTGMWRRPSCTPMVWPTMSGVTVLLRAQVLIRRFSFLEFILLLFSSRGAALAATVGVVAGVHGGSAHLGPAAQPAGASGLADAHVLVVHVAHLAYRGLAVHVHHAHLAGRQTHLGVGLVAGHELGRSARAPHQLPALAELQFYVVYLRAERDAAQRQSVAHPHLGPVARHDRVAHPQVQRGQYVPLPPIGVVDEG